MTNYCKNMNKRLSKSDEKCVEEVVAWVPPSLKEKLEEDARKEGLSLSTFVRRLLILHYQRLENYG